MTTLFWIACSILAGLAVAVGALLLVLFAMQVEDRYTDMED